MTGASRFREAQSLSGPPTTCGRPCGSAKEGSRARALDEAEVESSRCGGTPGATRNYK